MLGEERELRLLLGTAAWGHGRAEAQIASFFDGCSLKKKKKERNETIRVLLLKPQQQQLDFFQMGTFKRALSVRPGVGARHRVSCSLFTLCPGHRVGQRQGERLKTSKNLELGRECSSYEHFFSIVSGSGTIGAEYRGARYAP